MDFYTWMCQCWPTRKDLHQLCADTRCSLEDLPGVIDDKGGWQERVKHNLMITHANSGKHMKLNIYCVHNPNIHRFILALLEQK